MKRKLRDEAIRLRRKGWSYNMIRDKLNVSKSSLSLWLRDTPYTPNSEVKRRVNSALLRSVMKKHKAKRKTLKDAEKWAHEKMGELSQRDLFILGLGIYIGEGGKKDETPHVINADPKILRASVDWFHNQLGVPMKNFAVILHIYPDNNELECKKFWSKTLNIPREQFSKTQIDTRKNKSKVKHRILPYGTARVKVRACGDRQFGVILHRRIMALISQALQ